MEKEKHGGLIALIICAILTIIIIVACVFFPEQVFGLFK